MTQITEKFGDKDEYEVLLDTDMNGDGQVTGCWITHTESGCSASLAAAEATGILEGDRGGVHSERTIPGVLIEEIATWAEENGY